MIFQTGSTARLPRTPRTPRSAADHYFAESVPPTPAASEYSDAGLGGEFANPSAAELSPDEVRLPMVLCKFSV